MNNTFKLIGIAVAVATAFATASCDNALSTANSNGGNVQIDPQYQGIWEPHSSNPLLSSLISVEITDTTIIFTWSGGANDKTYGPFTAVTKSSFYNNYDGTSGIFDHLYSNGSARVRIILDSYDLLRLSIKLPDETNETDFSFFRRSDN